MCFSASASFGAAIVLTAIGTASLKKVQTPSQGPFAAIPLLFAVQQISEGLLWLALGDPDLTLLSDICTYNFLFFAQVVWPFWVPFSIFKLEQKEKRKKILKIIVAVGIIISSYLLYCLFSFPVSAEINEKHIAYIQHYPENLKYLGGAFYLIATLGPPFISGVKWVWALGTAILISYVVTLVLYSDYVISVWCFFAAVISATVFVVMHQLPKEKRLRKSGHLTG